MHRFRQVASSLLLVLLVSACSERATPTENPSIAGPLASFINNPDNGNVRIVRFQDGAGFVLIDDNAGLFSLQAGTNRQFGCVTPPTFLSFHDVQGIVHNPDDPAAGMIQELRLNRNAYIAVYRGPFSEWNAAGRNCADLAARKLAEGTGNFTNTDNDLLVFLRENKNANAFGFVAQGRLQRVGGGTAVYNGVSKCVWDGEDGNSIKCVDKINFR